MSLLSDISVHHHELMLQHRDADHLKSHSTVPSSQMGTCNVERHRLSALEDPASFYHCFGWVRTRKTPFSKSKQTWKIARVVCIYSGGKWVGNQVLAREKIKEEWGGENLIFSAPTAQILGALRFPHITCHLAVPINHLFFQHPQL